MPDVRSGTREGALMADYCTVPGCERPSDRGRERCCMHEKRHQRGGDMSAPVVVRLPPRERFIEACNALAEAEDDAEYESAQKAALAAFREMAAEQARAEASRRIKAALARARAAGVRIGRPPSVDPHEAARLYATLRTLRAVAAHLRVNVATVHRAVMRNRSLSQQRCPRSKRGSTP